MMSERKRPLSVFNTAHKLTKLHSKCSLQQHYDYNRIQKKRSGDMICNYFICCNEVQLFISIWILFVQRFWWF